MTKIQKLLSGEYVTTGMLAEMSGATVPAVRQAYKDKGGGPGSGRWVLIERAEADRIAALIKVGLPVTVALRLAARATVHANGSVTIEPQP